MDSSTPIRAAKLSDLDTLHRLDVESFGGSATPLAQLRWLLEGQGEDPIFFVRVAYEDTDEKSATGFICWKKKDDQATPSFEILTLSVGKNFRDERIEHALLADVIEFGTKEGMVGISVNVARSNLAAAAFYLSHNFQVGHLVPRYYGDGSDMEVFVKRLR
jgi:ribosomal protein S18 acetylase RimI-like enzyme